MLVNSAFSLDFWVMLSDEARDELLCWQQLPRLLVDCMLSMSLDASIRSRDRALFTRHLYATCHGRKPLYLRGKVIPLVAREHII